MNPEQKFTEFIKEQKLNNSIRTELGEKQTLNNFVLVCDKCSSKETIIQVNSDECYGSELTGNLWTDYEFLVKCKKCGCAEEVKWQR